MENMTSRPPMNNPIARNARMSVEPPEVMNEPLPLLSSGAPVVVPVRLEDVGDGLAVPGALDIVLWGDWRGVS